MRPLLHQFVYRIGYNGQLVKICRNCTNLETPWSIFCVPRFRKWLGRVWWGS